MIRKNINSTFLTEKLDWNNNNVNLILIHNMQLNNQSIIHI
jgi:hypothetical protein